MTTLSSHEAVTELISLMQDNGRQSMAEELVAMVAALDSVEAQHRVMLSMVHDARKQLAETPGHDHPATEKEPAQVFQAELEQILGQFSVAKESVIAWSKTTMENFGQVGASALDAAFSNLDASKLLGNIQGQVEYSTAKVMASLQQTDRKRAALLSFLIAACTSPSKLKRLASKAAEIVKQEQGKDKKPSLWRRLGKKKEEIAAHPALKSARNQKGAER